MLGNIEIKKEIEKCMWRKRLKKWFLKSEIGLEKWFIRLKKWFLV